MATPVRTRSGGSSCGSNSTVAVDFTEEAESSSPPPPARCYGHVVEALHSAVNRIRADAGLPAVRSASTSARSGLGPRAGCQCDPVPVPTMIRTATDRGYGRSGTTAGEEARWAGWLPW